MGTSNRTRIAVCSPAAAANVLGTGGGDTWRKHGRLGAPFLVFLEQPLLQPAMQPDLLLELTLLQLLGRDLDHAAEHGFDCVTAASNPEQQIQPGR